MVGLSRAFLYAGAESVVVSLWQVADESTAELMVSFYRELERGGPGADKAEALRAAKRAMISGGGPRAHPYYWAPFILIGSPEAAAPR
jgi:CHAT domain-containing protein